MSKPNPLMAVLESARSLDRRRQAQIANQVEAINRLLKNGEYGEEMKILHQAAAQLQFENATLVEALRGLVSAIDAMPMDAISPRLTAPVKGTLADALSTARTIVTPAAG